MFSKQELKELATFSREEPPVLSVYLDVDQTRLTPDQYRLTLKGMLKSVADRAASEDIQAVENYIEFEYDWHGKKGLALFSAGDFWRAYSLAFPVGDRVHVGRQPYIKPLADYADAYDRYGVVLVDREGARLFIFQQGALQEATGTLGEEITPHVKDATGRGGRSSAGPGQGKSPGLASKLDQIAARNLRDVVELTQEFYRAGQCERIILGGTADNRARFLSMLPKPLQSKVIGDAAIDMYASEDKVLERTMGLIQESVGRRKVDLVQDLITAARKGAASLGVVDTLLAMQEQRVQTLVIAEDFHVPGYVCTHCNSLTTTTGTTCPVCGSPLKPLEDIVEQLVHRAIAADIEVVFVDNSTLPEEGGIGAVWRF